MSDVLINLNKKHVLITGASSGIGRATAISASKSGASITLIARNEDELIKTKSMMQGDQHHIEICDFHNLEQIEIAIKNSVQHMGAFDGMVHCAGFGQNRPLNMTKPDFVKETCTVSFYAFIELIRIISKRKNINDNASIIGVSSVASLKGDKTQGAYAASKAAMNGVVPVFAKELSPRKIRVNNVAFGMINTEMYQKFLSDGSDQNSLSTQYLGVGEPNDAANILCFLLSDASRLITGTVLVADNGYLS